jgi:shikimate kinase
MASMWLIGMMGSGKTTIGAKTAEVLGVPFFDTDAMVVEMTGMTIDEIWADHGESGFRHLESRAVRAVPASGCVAAAGGGAVLDEENCRIIRSARSVVWLRCEPGELAGRVGHVGRPLLGDTDPEVALETLAAGREKLYATMATHVIDTQQRDVGESVAELTEIWNG